MNVKEYANANGMSQTAVKKKFGLTHWKQQIPAGESVVTEPIVEAPPVIVQPTVVETKSKQAKATVEEARSLQGRFGFKNRDYLRYVEKNKAFLPTEYELSKHLIERYL